MILLLSAQAATITMHTDCYGAFSVDTRDMTRTSSGEHHSIYTFPTIVLSGFNIDRLLVRTRTNGGASLTFSGRNGSGDEASFGVEDSSATALPSHSIHLLPPDLSLADFNDSHCNDEHSTFIGGLTDLSVTREGGGLLTVQSECFDDISVDTTTLTLVSQFEGNERYNMPSVETSSFTFDRVNFSPNTPTTILELLATNNTYLSLRAPLGANPSVLALPAPLPHFTSSMCTINDGDVDGDVTDVSYAPWVGVEDQAADVVLYLEDAYSGPAGASLPEADAIASDLQALADLLVASGCEINGASAESYLAGAYSVQSGTISGHDSLTVLGLSGTLGGGSFSSVLSDGTTLDGTYNSHRKWVGSGSGSDYGAGHWKRIKGARGVFYGVTGACEPGSPATAALSTWLGTP